MPQVLNQRGSGALVWFRRDLRDVDHAALAAALEQSGPVWCVFCFDTDILGALSRREDRRVHFIHAAVLELDAALRRRGGGLMVRVGRPAVVIPALARQLAVAVVCVNRDYEPQAKARDAAVAAALQVDGIDFLSFKDQAIFEADELKTQAGRPYTVFTPYRRAWEKRLACEGLARYACVGALAPVPASEKVPPTVQDVGLGFLPTDLDTLGIQAGMSGARAAWADFQGRLSRYAVSRDFPAIKGVSYLSVHLRFGTISIRELVADAAQAAALGDVGAQTWLSELIWRDFYFMILDQFPHVLNRSFRPEYDAIVWADWPEGFAAWCAGQTGYPLVDAAMRQLKHSGYMHNRLRMVVASFLCKDLGIDWRLGEAYFADELNDFDLSANNGGWQWAASSGCDAQPYFRIFNPVTQSEKFDPDGRFIGRYVPELAAVPERHRHAPWRMSAMEQERCGVVIGRDYPAPLVMHDEARQRTLVRYAVVKHQT